MPIKKPLDRRTFLRGTGVALSLPFLEAMLPINRSWAAEPLRFGVFFRGHGMTSAEGITYKGDVSVATSKRTWHPDLLKIYEPYPTTYIGGLQTQKIENNHTEIPAFMANTTSSAYPLNKTVDQIAAGFLNQGVPFQDGLYVGIKKEAESADLKDWLSHSNGIRNPMYWDPKVLFNLLTKSGGNNSNLSNSQLTLKKDVLSLTMDSIKSLQRELSSQDKIALDKTLTSYRQAEIAIQNLESGTQVGGGSCNFPAGLKSSYEKDLPGVTLPLLADLMAIAVNCGLTRTFAFKLMQDTTSTSNIHDHLLEQITKELMAMTYFNSVENKPWPITAADWQKYHACSHDEWAPMPNGKIRTGNIIMPACRTAMRICCKWESQDVVARFLSQLDSQVLDASAIVLGSGGAFDSAHPSNGVHENCPFVIFGRMGGKLVPQGKKLINRAGYDVGNAFLSILKNLGYTGNSFGSFNPTKTMSFT